MPRRNSFARNHIYTLHDEPNAIVYILAVWGAPKTGDPVLFDPRERSPR